MAVKTWICLAAVPYRSMKQRPQHIAEKLAERNYRVIYINYYEEFRRAKSETYDDLFARSGEDFLNKLEELRYAEEARQNLYIVKKVVKSGKEREGLSNFLVKLQDCFGAENTYIYVQFPIWVDYLEGLSERVKIVYDCLDDWEEFVRDLDIGYDETLIFMERKLVSLSDLVVASAIKLYAKMACIHDKVIYVPNGVSTKDYRREPVLPDDLRGIKEPIVFFMGALEGWVDHELIAYLAKERPNYSIVLVGSTWSGKVKLRGKNIFYLGKKRYQELVNYVKQARVAIVPFKVNKLTVSVTPLKFYEYLSAGVPVVTTLLPDLEGIAGGFVAGDRDEFIEKIDHIVNLDDEEYGKLSRAAVESSERFEWDNLVDEMLRYAEDPEKAASINTKEFISERIAKYMRFSSNPIIRNEMLFLSNLIRDFGRSAELGNELLASEQNLASRKIKIDYNQLALALFREGDYERSRDLLIRYYRRNSKDKLAKAKAKYIGGILKRDEGNRLLEIILLKSCGFYIEAMNLLDQYITERGADPVAFGLLASLLLEMHEIEAALCAVSQISELASGEGYAQLLEPSVLIDLIEPLLKKGEYVLAEKMAFMLYKYKLDEIADKKLGYIYYQSHLHEVIMQELKNEQELKIEKAG